MGFIEWITGRDEKESDVYANFDRVETVVDNIKNIATQRIDNAKIEVDNAISNLNNVNGLAQYVGQVSPNVYDAIFEEISKTISTIGDQLTIKANDIKAYEEASGWDRFWSGAAMAGSKIGEGFLSVFEGIGDGVVSIAGWIAPEDSGFEKACEDFVKADWSHDAFNFYYESDYAKKSWFTEDSGLASGFKIVGETAGYLTLGGFVSGAGGVVANSSKVTGMINSGSKVVRGGGKALKAAGTFAKSTTRVNTLNAALGGMGSGTETGIRSGLSIDDAARSYGTTQAIAQGTVAWGAGKLGEYSQKSAAKKAATKQVNDAKESVTKARDAFKSADAKVANARKAKQAADTAYENAKNEVNVAIHKNIDPNKSISDVTIGDRSYNHLHYGKEVADKMDNYLNAFNHKNQVTKGLNQQYKAISPKVKELKNAKDILKNSQTNLEAVNKTKLNSYQGYTDGLTRKGQSLGEKYAHSVGEKGFVKATISPVGNGLKTATNAIKHPLSTSKQVFNNVKDASKSAYQSAKIQAKNAYYFPDATATNILNATKEGVSKFIGPAGVAPIVGTVANATGSEISEKQFRKESSEDNNANNKTMPTDVVQEKEAATPDLLQNVETTDTTGGSSTGGSSTGGSSTGGSSTGGSPTGGSTSAVDNSSIETLTPEPPKVDTSKPVPPTNNPSTPNTTPPTENGAGNGMSDGMTEIEEPVPGTPETPVTPPSNNNDSTNGAADNIGNIISGGNNSNNGGNYTGSVMGSFNNNHNNIGGPTGSDAGLSYEDKPGIDILDDEPTLIGKDNDAGLDVISIDKGKTGTPSTSNGGVSAVIPTVLGVGAAAAAGVAGVHYIKKKKGAEDNEYYEDENDNQSSFLGEYKPVVNDNYDFQSDNQDNQVTETPKYKAGTVNQLSLDDGSNVIINEDNNIISPQREELE